MDEQPSTEAPAESKMSRDEEFARREAEVPRDEKALADRLLKQIHKQRDSDAYKQFLAEIKLNRVYAAGEPHSDGANGTLDESGIVRANLILPELKKALIEAYARDPEFACEPTKAVPAVQYNAWRNVGLTCERLLTYMMKEAKLKKHAKRAVRSADTTAVGWIKMVYQKHIITDPLLETRLSDVQDDIQRLDRLMAETQERGAGEEYEAKKAELQQQVAVLEEQLEVKRVDGFVLSPRLSENVTVSPDAQCPEDYATAEWIDDMIWMTVDRATERFGWVPPSATRYTERSLDQDAERSSTSGGGGRCDGDMWVCVHEMWRLTDRRIYTMIEGFKGFIRRPYTPSTVGERFHGLFPLYFDAVDGRHHPIALVSQLRSLQDEHTTARTNFREHRERNVPFNVANGQALGETTVKKLTNPKFMETVVVGDLDSGLSVEQAFKHYPLTPIDPTVYGTQHIREDWEQVTRRGDAARGVVAKAKTAAEAQILQSNLNLDQSERQDVVEEFLQELAQYGLEILLQELTPAQVKRIAGPESAWPELAKDDVFNMVHLSIQAGSTGKPRQQENLDKWVRVLPELRDTLIAIVQLREAGKHDEARIQTTLLKESLRRFDERLNVEELIPEPTDQDKLAQQQAAQQQAAEQRQMLALQMRELLSKIGNKDADTIKKLAEAEAQEAGQQIDLYLSILDRIIAVQQPAAPAQLN